MRTKTTIYFIYAFALFLLLQAGNLGASVFDVDLPSGTTTLKESTLPGYTLATQKCTVCHSVDYIRFQPPDMNLEQWIGEVKKMQHSYGAPLVDSDISAIGAYLAVAYGSANAKDEAVIKASAMDTAVTSTDSSSSIDVQKLLAGNTCLACHSVENKIVGPAFKDVAKKYRNDPEAISHITSSIKNGSSGKWGPVPMPPISTLNDNELGALAEFILQQ